MNYAKDSLPEMRLYSYTTSSNMGNGQTLHIGRNGNAKLPVKTLMVELLSILSSIAAFLIQNGAVWKAILL